MFIKNIIASSFTIQDHVGKTSIIFFFSLIMGDNMTNCHKMIEYCISFRILRRHLPLIFYEKINCRTIQSFGENSQNFGNSVNQVLKYEYSDTQEATTQAICSFTLTREKLLTSIGSWIYLFFW